MLKIESNKSSVEKSAQECFQFLSDLNNTGKLMPDQITNWTGNSEKVSYTIKGMADLVMSIQNRKENALIDIKSDSDKPFGFTIHYHFNEINPTKTEFYITFEGDVNPFLKMMVEKPLTNLFNFMAGQLPKVLN